MNLKDYKNNDKNKVENLTQFFDDNGKWQVDYIDDCEDFLNNYLECCYEGEIYLGELEDDLKTLVQYLIDNNETDLIYDACEGDRTHGIYRRPNEIASISFGEVELQFTGLYDSNLKINCIYTELIKDMSEGDIKKAQDNSGYHISGDCIYIDYSYDRASLILNEGTLIDNFLEGV